MPVNRKDAEFNELNSEMLAKYVKSTSTKEYRDKYWGDYKPNVFKQQVLGEFTPWPEQMKVDLAPMRSGKTTRAIEWAKGDKNRVIVVGTMRERGEILTSGLDSSQVVTWDAARDPHFRARMHGKVLWIDDADDFLKKTFHLKIAGISLTDNYPE